MRTVQPFSNFAKTTMLILCERRRSSITPEYLIGNRGNCKNRVRQQRWKGGEARSELI